MKYAYIYLLNSNIRSAMLCFSGFELYSRWVPLKREWIQKANFCSCWYIFLNAHISAVIQCYRGDLIKTLQRHCGMMGVKDGCFFYVADRTLQQCFKPQLYQIEKSWFCVHVCGKNRRQHSVILLINGDGAKPLVCHA